MKRSDTIGTVDEPKRILEEHLKVGPRKPVSYLPIRTIESMIGLGVPRYRSLVERSGNKAAVFNPDECCINSGAVYAYSYEYLDHLLDENRDLLTTHGWPVSPDEFIKKMAERWVENDHPVMPVIVKAFGGP